MRDLLGFGVFFRGIVGLCKKSYGISGGNKVLHSSVDI